MTLLQQIARDEIERREQYRQQTLDRLRRALAEIIPGQRVFVFGSLVKQGKFTEESDIDLALEAEPPDMTIYQLISLLSERMGCEVDVLLLDECRFRERVLKESEIWMPQS